MASLSCRPNRPPVDNGDSPKDRISIQEPRGLLRGCPIDRTSLPASIENLRRAELVEALRQIGAIGLSEEGINPIETTTQEKIGQLHSALS